MLAAVDELMEWVQPKDSSRPWKQIPDGVFLPSLKRAVASTEALTEWALEIQEDAIDLQTESCDLVVRDGSPGKKQQIAIWRLVPSDAGE